MKPKSHLTSEHRKAISSLNVRAFVIRVGGNESNTTRPKTMTSIHSHTDNSSRKKSNLTGP